LNKAVLDSSAVLAVLQGEPGAEIVLANLPGAFLSTVNLAEVITKLTMAGLPAAEARLSVEQLRLTIVDFTSNHAEITGGLQPATGKAGLSLSDRACLALAGIHDAKALTTDRSWTKVSGFEVVLIRGG
jgi:PIN domain nuclease of toxin-antitoxin system